MLNESVMDIIEMRAHLPSIAVLYRDEQESEHYKKYMAFFMNMLNESFNLNDGKGLSSFQIDLIVDGTHTKFPWFRLNDVFKVVQGFMFGEYKIDFRLDPPIWFAACIKYDIEFGKKQSEYLEKKHHNSRFEEKPLISWEDINGMGIRTMKLGLKVVPPPPDKKKHITKELLEQADNYFLTMDELLNDLGVKLTYRQAVQEFTGCRTLYKELSAKERKGKLYVRLYKYICVLNSALKKCDAAVATRSKPTGNYTA